MRYKIRTAKYKVRIVKSELRNSEYTPHNSDFIFFEFWLFILQYFYFVSSGGNKLQ